MKEPVTFAFRKETRALYYYKMKDCPAVFGDWWTTLSLHNLRVRRKENGKLTPADKGVDAQPDLVGRKRLDDEHVEVKK